MGARWRAGILGLLGAAVAAACALVLMIGMFWVLEVLPLAGFIALAIVYGFLSHRSPDRDGTRRAEDNPPQAPVSLPVKRELRAGVKHRARQRTKEGLQ